jgi:hypothetical protein
LGAMKVQSQINLGLPGAIREGGELLKSRILFSGILFLLLSCSSNVEKAERLWGNNKRAEAIELLEIATAADSADNKAAILLEKYRAEIIRDSVKALWQNGKENEATSLLAQSLNPSGIVHPVLRGLYERYTDHGPLYAPNPPDPDKPVINAGLVYELRGNYLDNLPTQEMWAFVPSDKSDWPLLTRNPYNSFRFALFMVNNENFDISEYEKHQSDLRLDKIDGFDKYHRSLKNKNRYEKEKIKNEIIEKLTEANLKYRDEYKRLCETYFRVKEEGEKISYFDNAYNLKNQTIELVYIGPNLRKSIEMTRPARKPEFIDNTYYGSRKIYSLGAHTEEGTVNLAMPLDIAERLSKSSHKPRISYEYLIEPFPGKRNRKGVHVGDTSWMPFRYFIIHRIIVSVYISDNKPLITYTIQNIKDNTIEYYSSVDSVRAVVSKYK